MKKCPFPDVVGSLDLAVSVKRHTVAESLRSEDLVIKGNLASNLKGTEVVLTGRWYKAFHKRNLPCHQWQDAFPHQK